MSSQVFYRKTHQTLRKEIAKRLIDFTKLASQTMYNTDQPNMLRFSFLYLCFICSDVRNYERDTNCARTSPNRKDNKNTF